MSEHRFSGPSIEDRVRSLELALSESRPARRQPVRQPRGLRRGLTIAATIVAVVILPMAAFASDSFSDVPAGGFHDAIDDVFDARITNGCTATTYCPSANVNRGQMAAFLSRGLPRAASVTDFATATADGSTDVAEVMILTGGVSGGTGYVVVTGSITGSALNGTTCICEIGVRVRDTGTGATNGLWQFFDVQNTASPSGYRNGTGTITFVFEVPTATTKTYAVTAEVDVSGGTPSLDLQGTVTAVYVPFSADAPLVKSLDATTNGTTNGRPSE